MATSTPADKLVVALDYPATDAALHLVDQLGDAVRWYKIGLELYTAAGGTIVRQVGERGKRVFLDLKFHDIPNTVAGAARIVAGLGVGIFNVHAAGGLDMMRAAKTAAAEGAASAGVPTPQVYGVTVLTSLGDREVREEVGFGADAAENVLRLAALTQQAGLDGVVASPKDILALRKRCGPEFGILTPGIRPAGGGAHDQRRIATPAEAVRDGATHIVVGRAITQAPDPVTAARAILDDIAAAQ